MEYEEFKEQVLNRIRDFLPEKYAGADISLRKAAKTNDTMLDEIVIQVHENAIKHIIHLDTHYEAYLNGWSMENILRQIAGVQFDALEQEYDHTTLSENSLDFDKVKDRITCRLVNIELNRLFLADRPYTRIEDLAVVYNIQMGRLGNTNSSIPIKQSLFESFGVDIKVLHRIAVENMERLSPCVCGNPMERVMGLPPCPVDKEDVKESGMPFSLFLLMDKNGMYGAAAVLNDKMMGRIAESLGGNFYVLPSSIDEVMVLPKEPSVDLEELERMVKEINFFKVAPDEVLSDHVYEYHAEERRLVRCGGVEERKMAGELDKGKNEKPSIKEQLAMPPVAGEKPVLKSGPER